MPHTEIIVSLLLLLLLWQWMAAIRVKELAIAITKSRCREVEVTLLDDTVALEKISLARSPQGRLSWRRCYRFEFSSEGDVRYQGQVCLLGQRLQTIEMEAYRISDYNS